MRDKKPYSEFFWSVFFCIGTEYGPEKISVWTLFTQCITSKKKDTKVCANQIFLLKEALRHKLEGKGPSFMGTPIRYTENRLLKIFLKKTLFDKVFNQEIKIIEIERLIQATMNPHYECP